MNAAIIRFGAGNSTSFRFEGSATIRDAVQCSQVQQELGFPANVRARIDSVEQDLNEELQDGDVVDLETVGTSKAS
jgi:hypothetical protein